MPDLKEATNHLAPLKLPSQLAYYYGGKDERFGWEVRVIRSAFKSSDCIDLQISDALTHRSPLNFHLFAQSELAFDNGY